jgi:hypothetical protein
MPYPRASPEAMPTSQVTVLLLLPVKLSIIVYPGAVTKQLVFSELIGLLKAATILKQKIGLCNEVTSQKFLEIQRSLGNYLKFSEHEDTGDKLKGKVYSR